MVGWRTRIQSLKLEGNALSASNLVARDWTGREPLSSGLNHDSIASSIANSSLQNPAVKETPFRGVIEVTSSSIWKSTLLEK
jgi:hypothetical protein